MQIVSMRERLNSCSLEEYSHQRHALIELLIIQLISDKYSDKLR